ncbi:MAG: ribulose-phosphate 3-epimerase [Bacteroidales bacterium]|nr:ribulose-phosphate 3-epimerase [Bacteroidales bacterium]MBR4817102.1 ribulose-phosphate 3-epimerase [Bacteroidales bacterium]MBR5054580.1 ribulose-phosphate 3-epimerase [Bacteroidales bacterium]
MRLLAPSILSADFLHLEKDIRLVNDHADIIHFDVMDGTLVPNISFGFPVLDAVARIAEKPMDAHLMIINPDKYFERCAKAGVSMLSFHLEAARKARKSPARLLDKVRSLGMKAGLAINPDIPVEDVFPYLDHADYILVMSVFAGFGGQKLVPETYDRVRAVKAEIVRRGLDCLVQIDGGADESNAVPLFEAGVDIVVAGSAVFKSPDPVATIAAMKGD